MILVNPRAYWKWPNLGIRAVVGIRYTLCGMLMGEFIYAPTICSHGKTWKSVRWPWSDMIWVFVILWSYIISNVEFNLPARTFMWERLVGRPYVYNRNRIYAVSAQHCAAGNWFTYFVGPPKNIYIYVNGKAMDPSSTKIYSNGNITVK